MESSSRICTRWGESLVGDTGVDAIAIKVATCGDTVDDGVVDAILIAVLGDRVLGMVLESTGISRLLSISVFEGAGISRLLGDRVDPKSPDKPADFTMAPVALSYTGAGSKGSQPADFADLRSE